MAAANQLTTAGGTAVQVSTSYDARSPTMTVGVPGSVSWREIARHTLPGPGEVSIIDEHYGGPARAVRARTGCERAFLALGALAEGFLRAAAEAGISRLAAELTEISGLEAS